MTKLEPKEQWLLPVLKIIGARPGVYLGSETVAALECYINGYASARKDVGYPEFGDDEGDLLTEFNDWLKKKLGREDSNLWWSKCIEIMDPSDHNARTFFAQWEAFLISKGISIASAQTGRVLQRWKDQV